MFVLKMQILKMYSSGKLNRIYAVSLHNTKVHSSSQAIIRAFYQDLDNYIKSCPNKFLTFFNIDM